MMIATGRYMSEQERENILRSIARNGISGTRLYLAGEPLSVFPDAFNSFVLWGQPAEDPKAQAAYGKLVEMGMEVKVVEVESSGCPMKVVKAVSTYDTFRYIFLDQITHQKNATF